MMAKEMIGNGYQIGKGLGRDLQGIVEPIIAIDNIGTFGLGFKPTSKDKRQAAQKKADAKMGVEEPMEMEPLSVTFPFSAGVMFEGAHDDSPVPPSDSTMIPDMGLEGLFVDAIEIDDGSGPSEINAVTPSQWTSFPLPALTLLSKLGSVSCFLVLPDQYNKEERKEVTGRVHSTCKGGKKGAWESKFVLFISCSVAMA